MEHVYVKARLCSEITNLKEKSKKTQRAKKQNTSRLAGGNDVRFFSVFAILVSHIWIGDRGSAQMITHFVSLATRAIKIDFELIF